MIKPLDWVTLGNSDIFVQLSKVILVNIGIDGISNPDQFIKK
jgi:hypothetical protein